MSLTSTSKGALDGSDLLEDESQPHVIKRTDENKFVDVVTLEMEDQEALDNVQPVVVQTGEDEKDAEAKEVVQNAGEAEISKDTPNDEEDSGGLNNGLRLDERTILKLQEAFSLFDHDSDGKLSLHQTANMIRAVGLGLTEKHIAEILAEAPTAKIDFGTFLTSMADHLRSIRENRAEEEAIAIKDAFVLLEETGNAGGRGGGGGSGMISRGRLTKLLSRVGEKLNKHEIDELLDDVGFGELSSDEEINYDALVQKIFEDY